MTLEQDLDQFYGTEHWYPHPLVPSVTYTDGVKYFAEAGQAWWFVDDQIIEFYKLQRDEGFLVISLQVTGDKAEIKVSDGNDKVFATKPIDYTDCPEGTYKFYYTNDVFLLASEY